MNWSDANAKRRWSTLPVSQQSAELNGAKRPYTATAV